MNPIRVGINARLLQSPSLRGWNRYTVNLLAELPGQGVEPVLYTDRPIHEGHLARLPAGSFAVRQAPPMRLLRWEHRWLPGACAEDGVALLHSPYNFGLPWSSPCPRVLTLHDAIGPLYHGRRRSWREHWGRAAARSRLAEWSSRVRAHKIITVSEHAKTDIVEHLGIPAAKVVVIAEAADPRFLAPVTAGDLARARGRHALAAPYVFYVGGWDERKRIPGLVRAFAAAGLAGVELVLAGGRDDERAALVELAEGLGVADRLHLLGWVEDEDLPALYAGALCFAYPSEYEGFGLQLCEAMAVGCPTLAARATSLPEVLGGGGETFELDELPALLRRVADDPSHRAELSRRARARASDFSWRRAAEQTAALYRDLVARG
ncbi:MAG TPA: glycosyltransferase family 1 protein [Isosphaeraceae bacterium]|jgi:hypothetical protein|nr:glycosyltransferase family 1 protein [Isosphaeraceae bacterium]